MNNLGTIRQIRVFISSTFRDMQEERDVLTKKIFPQIRKLCISRAVSWSEVDLRWGISSEQQLEGKMLPYCFAEIDRCRPYFIGLLAERYGWIPRDIPIELLKSQPWLKEHLDCSVTELEILYGVLNSEGIAEKALFYFRDPAYVASVPESQIGDFLETGPKAVCIQQKLQNLKSRIRIAADKKNLTHAPRENYANPRALGELVLNDFNKIIDELYPANDIPDALDQESTLHELYGSSHRKLYVGRPRDYHLLDEHVASDRPPLVLAGKAGSGKTALLANWADHWRRKHPNGLLIMHHVGASTDSTNTVALLTRLLQQVRRDIGFESEIPTSSEYLHGWFAYLISEAARKKRFVLIIDGMDYLDPNPESAELSWLPTEFPTGCRTILSSGSETEVNIMRKRGWPSIQQAPLEEPDRRRLLTVFLKSFGKTLDQHTTEQIVRATHTDNPLYLRTLLDELRYVGRYDHLNARLDECLRTDGIDSLLALTIRRWLLDYAEQCDLARQSLTLLLAARDGLSEEELMNVLTTGDGKPVPRAVAAPFLFAAEPVLAPSGYRLIVRPGPPARVISDLVASKPEALAWAHERLAGHFRILDEPIDRKLRELPYHLANVGKWQELHELLVNPNFVRPLIARHCRDLIGYWENLRPVADPAKSYRAVWETWQASHNRDHNWASLSSAVGLTLYSLGCYAASLDMLVDAAKLTEKIEGRESRDFAMAAKNLGVALAAAGQLHDAVSWLRALLTSLQRTIGLYNPSTFVAMSDLAGSLVQLGDFAAAEPLLRQVVDASSEIFGRRAPTTLIAMNNLAGLLLEKGGIAEAESLQRTVLEFLRESAADDDPFLLTAMNNLAGTLESQEKLNEAERWSRQVLTGRTQALGMEHPDTVQAMNNLAKLLSRQGNVEEAESLLAQGLAIRDRTRHSNPVTWATLCQNYAVLLAERGDLRAAEQLCRQSLSQFQSALPSDHPYLLGCLKNLGGILLENNDPNAAIPILREALKGYERTLGREHTSTRLCVIKLAGALAAQGNQDAAVELLVSCGIAIRDGGQPYLFPRAADERTEAEQQHAAFEALMAATSHDDLYAASERFGFITSTDFISRLEILAEMPNFHVRDALLERVALLRHLAAGKPLNGECNPVSEAFAAMRTVTTVGAEQLLLRLYPFLQSANVLEELRRMANTFPDGKSVEMINKIEQFVKKQKTSIGTSQN